MAVGNCELCCFGCLALFPGIRRRVINRLSFFPPSPPGYWIDMEPSGMIPSTNIKTTTNGSSTTEDSKNRQTNRSNTNTSRLVPTCIHRRLISDRKNGRSSFTSTSLGSSSSSNIGSTSETASRKRRRWNRKSCENEYYYYYTLPSTSSPLPSKPLIQAYVWDGKYSPMRTLEKSNGKNIIGVDTVELRNGKGHTIWAFHFQRPDANLTLVYSHGNSTDIGLIHPHCLDLCRRLEVNVLAYEYSGYGCSSGEASEDALYSDIDAAFEYLVHQKNIRASSLILYGQSMGSAPALNLAARVDVGGVILHSAFKSGLGVVRENAPKYTVWFDAFKNVAKIKKVRCPVLILHGTDDRDVGWEHSKALYDAAPNAEPPWWVKGAGHNNIETNWRDQYLQRLERFLSSLSPFAIPSIGRPRDPWPSLARATQNLSETQTTIAAPQTVRDEKFQQPVEEGIVEEVISDIEKKGKTSRKDMENEEVKAEESQGLSSNTCEQGDRNIQSISTVTTDSDSDAYRRINENHKNSMDNESGANSISCTSSHDRRSTCTTATSTYDTVTHVVPTTDNPTTSSGKKLKTLRPLRGCDWTDMDKNKSYYTYNQSSLPTMYQREKLQSREFRVGGEEEGEEEEDSQTNKTENENWISRGGHRISVKNYHRKNGNAFARAVGTSSFYLNVG